jgi:CRP-like cAMP-binding protein
MHETTLPLIKNKLLAALSNQEYQRLSPQLEHVDLPHGQVLYEMGGPVKYVYFPSYSMISLVRQMMDGKIIEVGLIGNDGMSGIEALMGEETSLQRAIVQIADGGMRAKLTDIKEEFNRGGELQSLLLGYARTLLRQIAQTAACNSSHTVEERLSRWLLMCHDRVTGKEFNLTQEFLAEMLGTRRATVSVTAMALQLDGLINYKRGHITIIDREGLESAVCECYSALKDC